MLQMSKPLTDRKSFRRLQYVGPFCEARFGSPTSWCEELNGRSIMAPRTRLNAKKPNPRLHRRGRRHIDRSSHLSFWDFAMRHASVVAILMAVPVLAPAHGGPE